MNVPEPKYPSCLRPPEWSTGSNPFASFACWRRGHVWKTDRSVAYCGRCLKQDPHRDIEIERLLDRAQDEIAHARSVWMRKVVKVAAERDAAKATVSRCEALADEWERTRGGLFGAVHVMELREALRGPALVGDDGE